MRIAIDVDGVLRDFCGQLTKIYKEDYPDHDVKPITTWWFHEAFPIGKEIYKYYVHQGHRIFRNAPAYSGAKEFVESLRTLGHQVIIVTTQPRGLEGLTLDWVNKEIGEVDGIAFISKKYLVDYDILLDDAPHNIEESSQNEKFAVFYTQPWNESMFYSRVESYKEFLELILDIETIKAEDIL